MSTTQPSMTEQNLPNGLPPQFGKPNMMPSPVSFNGVDSSHSSRTSSPANRLTQIPASQLPPSRSAIPASQLPPGGIRQGANINQLAQNYASLSVSQITPISSPKAFTTSTPVLNPKNDAPPERTLPTSELTQNFNQRDFSPIASNVASQITQSAFTHSAQSRFANVPLAASSQAKSDQFQNVPLRQELKPSNSNIPKQGESNNLTGSLSFPQNPSLLSNSPLNHETNTQLPSHTDKTSNLMQDQPRIAPLGQTDAQKRPVSAFFPTSQAPDIPSNNQPKMQQSLSQPLFEAPFKDVPLTTPSGNTFQLGGTFQPPTQVPKPVPSFGSTPNLYQNQLPAFSQNSPVVRQNLNHAVTKAYTNGSPQAVPPSTQFTLNTQQNSAAGPPNVLSQQNVPHSNYTQNAPPSVPGAQQKVVGGMPQPQFVQSALNKSVPPPTRTQPIVPYLSQQSAPRLPQQNQAHLGMPQLNAGFQQPQTLPPNSGGNQSTIAHSMAQANVPPTPSAAQGFKANLHANRYPTAQQFPNSSNVQFQQNVSAGQPQQQNMYQNQSQYDYQNQKPSTQQQQIQAANTYNQNDSYQNYNQSPVVHGGFSKLWGQENYDLLQYPNILPPTKVEPARIALGQDFLDAANCSPDIFRCTMTKIPESSSLLQKARLPLGVLIHPFKDLDHLPVIQCSTIVRCRACRTYINPFVFFVDMKRWKCNLCYRVNELPEEFQFDPVSKTYGDPSRRPEIKSSTIEYIAPSEYMLRPPQPAVYLFLLDVSHAAIESGYLHTFCNVLTSNLSDLPGDARTQVGFIAYNSALHFYTLAEGLSQPHEMTVLDIDDVFLPCPDNLIVNLHERKELVSDLLAQLPTRFNNSFDTGSALGAALQVAHKMIGGTGGRITVFQSTLPTVGPGALTVREDPSQRAAAEVHHLNPANDFYKRLALECSGQQIAVDLFVVNSQYVDLATISGISRFSGGCIHHFPMFKASRTLQAESLERALKRYLTRKIGFEAVMRIRCTRGLSIHTFHGNFFVRSTDLLSLPNVNPEAEFGMQVSIDESLSDLHTVCFQAALLYTSSKGERRIRVHTLCVPIASTLPDVLAAADQQCIVGLLSKMAVDRSMQSSLSDAREAFINVAIDILSSYKLSLNLGSGQGGLLAPGCLKLLPLYISALLKHVAFRSGTSTRLDDRVKAMCDMKTLPLYLLIQQIYPDLYPVHNLEDQNTTLNVDGEAIPQPPHLQLSARSLDSKGAFLMDMGEQMVLMVGPNVSQTFLSEALGVPDYNSITEQMYNLPNLDTPHNQRLNNFINYLNDEKPFVATLHVVRENSPNRSVFIEHLIEDRIETALSYHEFLQHLKTQVK